MLFVRLASSEKNESVKLSALHPQKLSHIPHFGEHCKSVKKTSHAQAGFSEICINQANAEGWEAVLTV